MTAAEPVYAAAMLLRNRLYDRGILRVTRVERPVISVGNLTTGGTGKTPLVRWLAGRLRAEGRHVAVLSRGYKGSPSALGDELQMLQKQLNDAREPAVLIRSNPDRVSEAQAILREHPEIDVLLMDDGFQHRRLARDFDLVLINAQEPFGFDHVLPRGLLREPLRGLRRADAVVLTHADLIGAGELSRIETRLRQYRPGIPIYRAVHAQTGLRRGSGSATRRESTELLSRRPFFAFCGLGHPAAFDSQLQRFGGTYVGSQWFDDHYRYTAADLEALRTRARGKGAELLVTTEKDWVKIEPLDQPQSVPEIWRIDLSIKFPDAGDARLLGQIRGKIAALSPNPRPT